VSAASLDRGRNCSAIRFIRRLCRFSQKEICGNLRNLRIVWAVCKGSLSSYRLARKKAAGFQPDGLSILAHDANPIRAVTR
jgi:hypothetical protein